MLKEDIKDFCRLVGGNLDIEELRYFKFRCNALTDTIEIQDEASDKEILAEDEIEHAFSFCRIMDCIETFSEDAKLLPEEVTHSVLMKTFPNDDKVYIKELSNFLKSLKSFSKAETNLILGEIRYLQSIKQLPGCEDIGLLLRDCCERFAK